MLHVNKSSECLGNNDRHVAWPCPVLQVLYIVLHLMSRVCRDCTLRAWIGSRSRLGVGCVIPQRLYFCDVHGIVLTGIAAWVGS